ncbi:MAG: winged helix-turn-helix domain-containing protein [Pseudomonadales bacterium]
MADQSANGSGQVRRIGSAEVDFDALTIRGPAGLSSLEPKVMAVLQVLVDQAPSVVGRQALIDQVWGGESGGDESLSRAVSLLRKAFGDRRGRQAHIETIPRRGYRLVASLDGPLVPAGDAAPARGNRRRYLWGSAVSLIGLLLGLGIWFAVTPTGDPEAEPAATLPDRSVAVLPFADLSPGGDQAYFADGLAEEILNALAGVPELAVAGRTSSFAYRDRDVDVRTIGTELGVRHVLEGSVRKAGDELRITAQLVRTDDGYRTWSSAFDGDLKRVFDFQEQIARAIALALEVTLDSGGTERLAPALTGSQAAYDAFLQARGLARRFGADEKVLATVLLEQAVALDPAFALAWAELARTELFVPISNPELDYEPHVSRARQAASRALELEPDLAMGHFVQGLIHEFDLDYANALESFAMAHRLEPGDPFLTIRYGYYLALIGQTGAALELVERGLRLDPTDAAGLAHLGAIHMMLGNADRALQLYQRSWDLGFAPVGAALAQVLAWHGDREAALAVWQAFGESAPGRFLPEIETPEPWQALGQALFDEDAAALAPLATMLTDYLVEPGARANTYRLNLLVAAGRPADAMRLFLENPYPISASFVFPIWMDDFGFAELRRHPDFPAFAERIGLVAAWDAHGWPERCQRVPQLEADSPSFRCE